MGVARLYSQGDYEAVREIVLSELPAFPSRDGLGGTGIVFEDNGIIQGFVWALTSETSSVCYIDYFIVKKDCRQQHVIGPSMITALFVELHKLGKRMFMGILNKNTPYSLPLARLYQNHGVKIADELYFLSGDVASVFSNLRNHYDINNRNEVAATN